MAALKVPRTTAGSWYAATTSSFSSHGLAPSPLHTSLSNMTTRTARPESPTYHFSSTRSAPPCDALMNAGGLLARSSRRPVEEPDAACSVASDNRGRRRGDCDVAGVGTVGEDARARFQVPYLERLVPRRGDHPLPV